MKCVVCSVQNGKLKYVDFEVWGEVIGVVSANKEKIALTMEEKEYKKIKKELKK